MKTGIIGLGAMGTGMARNLHSAGNLYRIWNRTREKADLLAKDLNIEVTETLEELATDCEMIITCVSRDEDVLEVI